jgi:hypothetical protein
MTRVGRRRSGLGFLFLIALSIGGAGVDVLPHSLILDMAGREESSDDAADDLNVDDEVSWTASQPGKRRELVPRPEPVEAAALPPPPRATIRGAVSGTPPSLPNLLCRLTC